MRMLAGAVLVLAAAAVGVLALGRGDPGQGNGRVGINTHLVWEEDEQETQSVLEQLREGGIEWVREELPWRVVEPEPGRFDWARTDALAAATSATGVNLVGILAYSAPWASSDPEGDDGRYPPRDPAEYARYAAAVLERYGPQGTFWAERDDLTPQPLRAVEIWNEPWTHSTWRPDPDPAAYAELVRAAVPAIRAVAPETTILVAGDLLQVRTDGSIVEWLREVLDAEPELASLVDAYSVHPYPDPRTAGPYDDREDPRWDYRRVELIRELDDRLPIWITEIGWSTAATDDSVDEATQADYLERAVRRALREWGAYVERVFVYSFDRDTDDLEEREDHYGLRRQDGSLKPAWPLLARLAR